MTGSSANRMQAPRRDRALTIFTGAIAAAFALALTFVAVALATGTLTISSASNSKLGERVVINTQGRTLYALSGESRSHQFCTSPECLRFWPPVRVSSKSTTLKAGSGVHGRLGILSRAGGILQVTLRGLPLYRYSGDRAKGQANGEGIVGPGGHIWHAATAASVTTHTTPAAGNSPMPAPSPAPPSPSPSPSPGYTPPSPGYTPPGYGY